MSLSKEATSKLFSVKYINCKRRYGMWKKILISSGLLACLSCPQFYKRRLYCSNAPNRCEYEPHLPAGLSVQ